MINTSAFSSTDLDQLQRQLDWWRQRQQGRFRLPPALWEGAIQLARVHGVSHVARRLRIDFYKLQQRVQRRASAVAPRGLPVKSSAPPFVELKLEASGPGPGAGGVVELFDGPHRRLRLETGHDPAFWLALSESFWRTRP